MTRRHDHLWHVLKVFAKIISQATQADRGEEVDCEAGVLRGVLGHNALEVLTHVWILQSFIELAEAKTFGELLEQNLDEDARRGRGGLFCELKISHARP